VELTGINLPLKHFPRMAIYDFSMLLISHRYSIDFEIPVNSKCEMKRFLY
jgi:hypothetical protein